MNNKKLFKGALVLFASILMAVSCSNNNTSPDEPGKTPPANPPAKQDIAISIKDDKYADPTKTDLKVTLDKDQSAGSAMKNGKDTAVVTLKGEDLAKIANVSTDNTKILVSVKSIEGLEKSSMGNNSAATETKEDINAVEFSETVSTYATISAVDASGGSATVKFTAEFAKALKGTLTQDKVGVLKVVLEFKDLSDTKNTITIDAYVLANNG